MINEKNLKDIRNSNIKWFYLYKMVGWDLLFFYALLFMFLTTVKNLSPADVIFIESLYIFFKLIFQPFATIIADKLGNRKSLIFANICVVLYILLIYYHLIFIQ